MLSMTEESPSDTFGVQPSDRHAPVFLPDLHIFSLLLENFLQLLKRHTPAAVFSRRYRGTQADTSGPAQWQRYPRRYPSPTPTNPGGHVVAALSEAGLDAE